MKEIHRALYILSVLQITTPASRFLTKAFGPDYRQDKTLRIAEDRAGHSVAGMLCLVTREQQEKMVETILEYDDNLMRARLARRKSVNRKK